MINYIIQVILFQALFLAVYDFFLAKETFFTKNRWYLLITGVGSFLIPLVKLPNFQEAVPREISIVLPEIVLSPQSIIEKTSVYQSFNYGSLVFWAGFSFFSLIFGYRLYKLIRLILKNSIQKKENYYLILISNSKKAFSFFDYVFIGTDIDENEKEKIISHELVHSKQRHSLDLLIFEGLKIVMWFNPLLYIYQKRISTVHEYISDSIIVASTEKKQYLNSLVNQLFDVEKISFVNQFYTSSLIKKRIKMITKEKSKQIKQVKYLLLIPMLGTMLVYTSCMTSSKEDKVAQLENEQVLQYIKSAKKIDSLTLEIEKLKKETDLKPLESLGITGEKAKKVSLDEVVLFSKIDEVPTFLGCPENDKKCFNRNIQKHFVNNFNVKLPSQLGLKPGKKRIIMMFKINKEGNVVDVRVKAPHKELEKESARIINLLPKMNPGKHEGKIVDVKYTLPVRIDVK